MKFALSKSSNSAFLKFGRGRQAGPGLVMLQSITFLEYDVKHQFQDEIRANSITGIRVAGEVDFN